MLYYYAAVDFGFLLSRPIYFALDRDTVRQLHMFFLVSAQHEFSILMSLDFDLSIPDVENDNSLTLLVSAMKSAI
jgi:hypothetical protein